jgi:hypothetical protein
MRIGSFEVAGSFTLRLVEDGKTYDLTQLTIEDLIKVRDHLDFVIQCHKNNAQEKLQPERETSAGAIRGHFGARPWEAEGV